MANFLWLQSQVNGFNFATLVTGYNAITANVLVTGNVWGGNWTVSGSTHVIPVLPYSTLDAATNSIPLYSSTTTNLTLPSVASTWYCVCAVKTTGGVQQVNAYLSEAAAAADPSINAYRILGWWPTLSTTYAAVGTCFDGMMQLSNNQVLIGSDTNNGTQGSTKTDTYAISSFLPGTTRALKVYGWPNLAGIGSFGISSSITCDTGEVENYVSKGVFYGYYYNGGDPGQGQYCSGSIYLRAVKWNR